MIDYLQEAAQILQRDLPEFSVNIVAEDFPMVEGFGSTKYIAVSLPQEKESLRTVLMRELRDRTNIAWEITAFNLNEARVEGAPQQVPPIVVAARRGDASEGKLLFMDIKLASSRGKLKSLTLQYLDSVCTSEDRDNSMQRRPLPHEHLAISL